MSEVVAPDAIERRPLSYEEFLALGENPRQEWVRGEALLMPPVTDAHGFAVGELVFALRTALPGRAVGAEIGFAMAHSLRGPDILVARERTAQGWVEVPPLLIVEVISAGTRSEGTVRKPAEYAEAGSRATGWSIRACGRSTRWSWSRAAGRSRRTSTTPCREATSSSTG